MLALVGLLAALAVAATVVLRALRPRRGLGSIEEQATYRALHTAGLATPHLRDGLTPEGAPRAARPLRQLLGVPALALTDTSVVLAWDGPADHHQDATMEQVSEVLHTGRVVVLRARDVRCADDGCPIRGAVCAPIVSGDRVVGTLTAYAPRAGVGLVRATRELAGWVSTHVELAELGRQRTRTMEAELRALRAQISPHFVYNSLAAIASFVRTDPDRARELLLEFADFTRYSFRRGGAFTTLAEELTNVERYLALEQARFGPRLALTLDIEQEVLSVVVPYLAIQPLVENAVRHGLEPKVGPGLVTLTARSRGNEVEITVEDDGVGADPARVRSVLSGDHGGDNVGLGNVDARLRQVYGDAHGLVVETQVGAGTTVTFRVPRYAPGVHAAPRGK
nr:histidine kinase [Arsenicicoccus piscis]